MSLQIPRLNDHYDRIAVVAEMESWLDGNEPTDEELEAVGLEPADYFTIDADELHAILEEEYDRA